jgi:hypothetical protein
MRLQNVFGIVASVASFILAFHYVDLSWRSFWISWDFDGHAKEIDLSHLGLFDVQIEATIVMLIFAGYFVYLFVGNMMQVKTTTSKVLTILGISLTGVVVVVHVFGLFGFGPSFLDAGPLWFVFAPIALAFSIVLLVQTYVAEKHRHKFNHTETIDDLI